jgi:hypothetical protein
MRRPVEFAEETCRTCGHPGTHHDAGECWTAPDGSETWGETSCSCGWADIAPASTDDGRPLP